MYELISLEQTISGAWYARISYGEDKSYFIKFNEKPTPSQIDEAANSFAFTLSNLNKEATDGANQ